jgi:branched-chain amino acid transport system substrate-binding protein
MRLVPIRRMILAMTLLAGCGLAPAQAAEPVAIDVILPLSGGGSFIGLAYQENLRALQEEVNRTGGITGRPVQFVFHDDETNPQQDVVLANQILASHPPVIIGSAIVALCNAMAPLMARGPVLYCLSPSITPPADGYIFSADPASTAQVMALVRYFREKGWTRLAVLNSTDATGQVADKDIQKTLALAENQSVQVVASEHFNPGDLSVQAQIEKIRTSGAQAMLTWTTGASIANVFKAMIQAGLDLPVGTSAGNQTIGQMEQYVSFMPPHLLIASCLFPEHGPDLKLDPRVEQAQADMFRVFAERKMRPDVTSAGWDVGLIVVDALRKLGPNASAGAVRDAIAGMTDFAGINGLYDFRKYPGRGLGPENMVVVSYNPPTKGWTWLSRPGGEPLADHYTNGAGR